MDTLFFSGTIKKSFTVRGGVRVTNMLSKSLFERQMITLFDEFHYEVLRTIGDPMILHDGADGHPIASVHLKHGPGGGTPCVITKVDELSFQALWENTVTGGEVFVVLTNLEYFDWIMFGASTDDIAEHIPIRAGGSYKLVLTPGTRSFHFTVCPTKKGTEYGTAKWSCADLICRERSALYDGRAPDAALPAVPEVLEETAVADIVNLRLVRSQQIVVSEAAAQPRTREELWKICMDLVYETAINRNRLLLASLDKKFVEDECAICMMDGIPPDVTLVKCGHSAVHDACLRKAVNPSECPVCRAQIFGKIYSSQ